MVFLGAAALSVVVGLVLGRIIRRQNRIGPVEGAGREWIHVDNLTEPAIMLAALLMAFMLVQTYASFQRAEEHAASEAATVLSEEQSAVLLVDADRDALQADLICYARSVVHQEWPGMAEGRGADAVTTHWEEEVRTDLVAAADRDTVRLDTSGLVGLESTRATDRRERIAEVEPAVPGALSWLIELTALSVLVLLCVFTWHLRPLVRLILVGTVAMLVLMVAVGVRELDTPFTGFVAVEPNAMEATLAEIDPGAASPALPCDPSGMPAAPAPASSGR